MMKDSHVMYQSLTAYKPRFSCKILRNFAKYVADYLEVSQICVNTHTHTHGVAHSYALSYQFSNNRTRELTSPEFITI